ncbi:RNA 3'-terminal phosphate cyclase/enolpyruvate transferase [Myxozyma melibiosi]|uniref:RNA 3'-terminal phosphate cyclase/enolpyruvate transferase n=1 Tax=Myxozyma melibiosi TaxID=54550 RepID=A0ABR1F385_9ASCO
MVPPPLMYTGHVDFRMRLVLATLSGRTIKIEKIRSDDMEPGLRDYEVSFLRLLEAVTNGSVIEISYTGTTVVYKPGLIVNGTVTHICPLTRAVGYFIEPILLLAPFGKSALNLTVKGVTSNAVDLGVDTIRTAIFPLYNKFGIMRQELRVIKRGSLPLGGGEVNVFLPHVLLQPQTLHAAVSAPAVSKIRGVAYSTRVSPASVNRIIDGARSVLNVTGCETFIFSDVARGEESGKSPGFGVSLVAETRSGWCYCSEAVGSAGEAPEDVGERAARALLEEVANGGMVSRCQAKTLVVLMVLGKEDVGRVLLGKGVIDEGFVRLLRDIKTMWGTEARLKEFEGNDFDEDEDDEEREKAEEYVLSIKGVGFVNSSKKIA